MNPKPVQQLCWKLHMFLVRENNSHSSSSLWEQFLRIWSSGKYLWIKRRLHLLRVHAKIQLKHKLWSQILGICYKDLEDRLHFTVYRVQDQYPPPIIERFYHSVNAVSHWVSCLDSTVEHGAVQTVKCLCIQTTVGYLLRQNKWNYGKSKERQIGKHKGWLQYYSFLGCIRRYRKRR